MGKTVRADRDFAMALFDSTMVSYEIALTIYFRQVRIRNSDSSLTRYVAFVFYLAQRNQQSAMLALRVLKRVAASLDDADGRTIEKFLDGFSAKNSLSIDVHYYVVAEICGALNMTWWAEKFFDSWVEQQPQLETVRLLLSSITLHIERGNWLDMHPASQNTEKLRNKIASTIQAKLAASIEQRDLTTKSIDKILFLFGHIQPLPNIGSHMRQIASYVIGFARQFPKKRVQLIVTNEMTTSNFDFNLHALPKGWKKTLNEQFSELSKKSIPRNLDIVLLDPQQSGDRYFGKIMQTITQFSPDIAFSWLGFFGSDLMRPAIAKICPLISIQFQAGNPMDPCSDLILAHGHRHSFNDLPHASIWRNHDIPLDPPIRRLQLDRNEIRQGCEQLIVTTLGGGRIETCFSRYSPQDCDRFVSMFERFPGLAWILIGVNDSEAICKADQRIRTLVDEGRIRIYTYFDDLRALYLCCDAYVHLPLLSGGGWGIALAIYENLPVLAESGHDADNFLPASSLFEAGVDWTQLLTTVLENDSARASHIESQTKRIRDRHEPEAVAKQLFEFAKEAQQLRAQR